MARLSTGYLTAESSSESQSGTIKNKKSTSSVHIMALNRGYTEEADRLLDYLVRPVYKLSGFCHLMNVSLYQEGGIFDALEKQYLRSLIFAIYLVGIYPHSVISIN